MTNWTMPPELNQSIPRKVKMRPSIKIMLWMMVVMVLLPIVALTVTLGNDAYKQFILKTDGRPANAIVTNLNTTMSRGRNRRTLYNVELKFRASGGNNSPSDDYRTTQSVSCKEYMSLKLDQEVPILYDPSDLRNAALNINDEMHLKDPFSELRRVYAVVLPAMLLVNGAIVFFILLRVKNEKILLMFGHVVSANILEEKEYNAGKAGRLTQLTYEFKDNRGQLVRGIRKALPLKNDKREKYRKVYLVSVENPTVVYDPNDSQKNTLYPANYVECLFMEFGKN